MSLNLKELSHDKLIELIESLITEVSQLKEENKLLKEENKLLKEENQKLKVQLGLNSSNSSKPPSTDGFKKKPKNNSLREKTDKNSGGQLNHKGHTLEKVDTPDFTVDIKDDICPCCSSNLQEISPVNITTRQVFDIPLPKIQVTEYKAYHKVCPHCNTKNNPVFPSSVTQPVSYGSNIQSLVTYLSVQNHIPYNRISSFVSDLFNCNLSEGTIFNILNRAYNSLANTENEIKNRLLESPQIHADETGIYVEKLRQWLFSYSNKNYTFYDFHKKRGKEAMDDIGFMENYRGIVTHDCWKTYEAYENCLHSFCNAHFLRELNGIMETTEFKFPKEIKETLLSMKKLVDTGDSIPKEVKDSMISLYHSQLNKGFEEELNANPPSFTKTGKQGRRKQSPAKNLLLRLKKIPEVLGFFIKPNIVPFDNNLAERDIRMVKVKQKVSGLHRSTQGAKQFCRVRGYLSTMRKNDINIWESINSIFLGTPIMP